MTILVGGRLSEKEPCYSIRMMQLKENIQGAVEPFASHPAEDAATAARFVRPIHRVSGLFALY